MSTDDSNVKIFKFGCPLHFANVELFTDFINDYFLKVGSTLTKVDVVNNAFTEMEKSNGVQLSTNTLVLDGGSIAYLDSMGIEALQNAYKDGQKVQTNVLYSDFAGK